MEIPVNTEHQQCHHIRRASTVGIVGALIGAFLAGSYGTLVARAQDAYPLVNKPKAKLTVKPSTLNFHKASQAEQQSFTLTASGGTVMGNVEPPSAQNSGFTIISNGGPFSLAPGTNPTRDVTVQYDPMGKGTFHS